MPYKDSHVWKLRQKIGHDLLVMPAVDTIAVREDGALLMTHNKDLDAWSFPGGYVEAHSSWTESALRELAEEGGIIAKAEDLVPFAAVAGNGYIAQYANGDITQPFSLAFLLKTWQSEDHNLDLEEVTKVGFFSLEAIDTLTITPSARRLVAAYRQYVKTQQFQVINVSSKPA